MSRNWISFDLTDYLKKIDVLSISYQHHTRRIYITFIDTAKPAIILDVWGDDIRKTTEGFKKEVKATMSQKNQEQFIKCIGDNWYKLIDLMNTLEGGNGDADADAQGTAQPGPGPGQPSPIVPLTKAELVIAVAKDNIEKLFVDEFNEPHVAIKVNDHLEVLALKTSRFRHWLSKKVYEEEQEVIDPNVFGSALSILMANAIFDSGDPIKLNLRVAAIQDQETKYWYYDLTNKNWEFVKISVYGWEITKDLIIFHRRNNQQAQVYPDSNYQPDVFDRFFKLVNIKTDDKYSILLLKCYIIHLFIPEIQKVVLISYGPQGAAKSSSQELDKMLVDPSAIRTLKFPRASDLQQQLSHNYVAYYDNISYLPHWISDELCRAVTGSASFKRELYTNDDAVITSYKRCIGINGINVAATKADLLDRSIITKHEDIDEKNRRTPEDIWKEFEDLKPQLLGYIFDILVNVLRYEADNPNQIYKKYRMAEFSKYGEIISRCMGNPDGELIKAYKQNREIQIDQVIESSQVATVLMYMMYEKYPDLLEWKGTPTSLYGEIKNIVDTDSFRDTPLLNINTKSKYWPKQANSLVRRLNEIETILKEKGLKITHGKDTDRNRTRIISIEKLEKENKG